MSTSVLTINIKPDIETIETFNDSLTIPNETLTITGTIEAHLTRPMQIRQIYIRFQGGVTSILSSIDYLRDKSNVPAYGDEIPLEKWETNEDNISLMDKVARKAFGYSNVHHQIIKECSNIVEESQELQTGTTSWPFSITINNVHQLPPSLLLPFHQIQYCLSAHIKLKNGISDRFKVSYWNTRMKIPYNNPDAQEIDTSPPSFEFSENSMANPQPPTKIRQYSLGSEYSIQLKQYTYPSLHTLHSVPRIRFRGARKDFLSYEVSMPKFTCLQKKYFPFICTFKSLSPEAIIDKIESYLIQVETYPIRAGNYTKVSKSAIQEVMVARNRKFCRSTHDLLNYEDGSDLELQLKLDLPHISPSIDVETLKISHKLRLVISFKNDTKSRNMTLSFPMKLGSVPTYTPTLSSSPPESSQVENTSIHVRQDLDQWLLTSEQYDLISSNDFNKLPSYRDVLREGNPPSPFLEDMI